MADEKGVDIPKGCDWPDLRNKSGSALTDHYADTLRKLGKTPGILGGWTSGPRVAMTLARRRTLRRGCS
jgi:type I restriction enzyme M protein